MFAASGATPVSTKIERWRFLYVEQNLENFKGNGNRGGLSGLRRIKCDGAALAPPSNTLLGVPHRYYFVSINVTVLAGGAVHPHFLFFSRLPPLRPSTAGQGASASLISADLLESSFNFRGFRRSFPSPPSYTFCRRTDRTIWFRVRCRH